VLQLAYEGVKVMLTGDATTDTEQFILGKMGSTFSLQSDVLKVGHHGSARTSSSKGWIEGVKPAFIFISSDRHGTLDEDEQKTRATGHRLPQELTLDIIRKATKLYDKSASHTYVSSYAPRDYVEYAETDRDLQDRHLIQENPRDKKQIGWPRGWYELSTTDAIFTTLVTIGGNGDEDGDDADQGCQYQLRISSGGGIEVTSTVDFFSTTTPLTPKK
jgi:hypothetical protein